VLKNFPMALAGKKIRHPCGGKVLVAGLPVLKNQDRPIF
jgi:hypothetical protein